MESDEALTYNNICLNGEEIVGANIIDIIERLYSEDEILSYFENYCNENIFV